MRYFEYKDEKSDKFWQIDIQGCDVITCYGKIGSAGRESTKSHDTEEKAQASVEKLIAQKVKKGYVENSSTGSTSAMPTAQKTAQTKPSNTVTEQKPKTASAETKNTTDTIEKPSKPLSDNAFCAKPSESMVWDSQFDNQLPIMRGVHTPKLAEVKLTTLDKKTKEQFSGDMLAFVEKIHELKAQKAPALSQQLANHTDEIHKHMRTCLMYSHWQKKTAYKKILVWIINSYVYDSGLESALTLFLKAFHTYNKDHDSYYIEDIVLPSLVYFREAIANSDDTLYTKLEALAEEYYGQFYQLSLVISYMFAHNQYWADQIRPGWALEKVRQGVFYTPKKLLASARMGYENAYNAKAMLMSTKLNGLAFVSILDTLLKDLTAAKKHEKPLTQLLAMTPMLDSTATFDALAKHCQHGNVAKSLLQMAERYPVFAFNQLLPQQKQDAVKEILHSLLTKHPDWHERLMMHCDEDNLPKLKKLLDSQVNYTDASDDELPEIFTNPPWEQKTKAVKLPVIALSVLENQPQIHWEASQKEAWLTREKPAHIEYDDFNNSICDRIPKKIERKDFKAIVFPKWNQIQRALFGLNIKKELVEDISAGKKALDDTCFESRENPWLHYDALDYLMVLPKQLQLDMWTHAPVKHWGDYDYYFDENHVQHLLAIHETAAIAGFIKVLPYTGHELQQACLKIEDVRLLDYFLKCFTLKTQRQHAIDWFKRYPKTTLIGLLPLIFAPAKKVAGKKRQDTALSVLKFIKTEGHDALLTTVVTAYQTQVSDTDLFTALNDILAVPDWQQLPKKPPKQGFIPDFLNVSTLPRPILNSGNALPVIHLTSVCNILAQCEPDMPYAGVIFLTQNFTQDSLAEFGWALFKVWRTANMPSQFGWMYTQLALLGDDEVAHKLTPLIREMPGQSAHANAVKGLAILKGIGTDMALMHLNGIAQKVKFKGLRDNAKTQIAKIAEDRGLSAQQLADRLVPDLGLDARGEMHLDFGSRTFVASFDEHLKPVLKNDEGKRLKNLPKPNKKDDAELAETATKAFKLLKKDARAIASIQLKRLELAMCLQRRWTYEEFNMLFVQHPFIRHLTQRLVWAVYDADNKLTHAFRAAEDLSFTNQEDDEFDLANVMQADSASTIGIAHILELNDTLSAGFGELFNDYEILQPFDQLGRQTFALTDEEITANKIKRFASNTYPTRGLMGLTNYGWERGEAQDGGWIGEFTKALPSGNVICLSMDPGMIVGDLDWEDKQKITDISVHKKSNWYYGKESQMSLKELSPIIASEILRDVSMLATVD